MSDIFFSAMYYMRMEHYSKDTLREFNMNDKNLLTYRRK